MCGREVIFILQVVTVREPTDEEAAALPKLLQVFLPRLLQYHPYEHRAFALSNDYQHVF
jgi:hypothetical protein